MSVTQTIDKSTDIKLIRCAITDPELIEALEQYSYDKDSGQKMLIEEAITEFLEEEGYL